jgi:hypothetical protein
LQAAATIDVSETEPESTAAATAQAEFDASLPPADFLAMDSADKSTAPVTAQAEFDAAPGPALAGDSAAIDGEKATGAEIEQAQAELFDTVNSPADANGIVKLTEASLQHHRDSVPDRLPSRATSTSLRGDAEAEAAAVPPASVSSVLDSMPPGSEAGLSLSETMNSFESTTATRSQTSTRSIGNQEEILPLCTKCGWPTEVFNAVLKTKASATQHAKYVCRPCNSIQTMVFRHLKQEGSIKMNSWDDDQLKEFYRKAQEATGKNGRAKWAQVRHSMKQVMLKRLIESTQKMINSEYKPLEVWAKMGYDAEMIAAYNRTNIQ